MSETMNILEVSEVSKRFGNLVAVDDVSFGIESGTFTGLIGPNGAGKSTLFDVITGMTAPTAGTILFNGTDITGSNLETNVERGLVRTFQQTRIFDRMTVRENLLVASQIANHPDKRADALLERFDLGHLRNHLAKDLSYGQQKLVSITQALMLEPDLVLLDEPFAGVNPTMESRTLEMVHDYFDQGVSFLLVEHDMDIIMAECEDIIVMDAGSILTRGSPEEVQQNKEVLEAYFGGGFDDGD
jgi:branched-chain amino acid transport system ATP-binding protein